jgi:hypothetical protein
MLAGSRCVTYLLEKVILIIAFMNIFATFLFLSFFFPFLYASFSLFNCLCLNTVTLKTLYDIVSIYTAFSC